MALNQQVFTNAGLNMLGQANAGQQLVISRIVVGAGAAAQDSDLYPLTALINWKSDVTITRQQDLGNGKMIVSGTLNEWEMGAGTPFPLRELGIMAHIVSSGLTKQPTPLPPLGSGILAAESATNPTGPSGQPIVTDPSTHGPAPEPRVTTDLLYCVANVYADAPDTVTPGGTTSRSFDITIEIDRAANVTIVIGGVGTYDCQNIPTTPPVNSAAWYAGREGNVFDFKRVVQGPGIAITELADRITIGVARLAQNVDLYVPASHPQCPDPSVGFPTIQAAHDYLLSFLIPADKTATIHVYLGHYTPTVPTVFSHPNSSQINVIGWEPVDFPVSGTIAVAALPLPDFDVTVTIPIGSGVAIGDVVQLFNSPNSILDQCGVVQSVTATTVRFRIHSVHAPVSIASGSGCRLITFGTQYAGNTTVAAGALDDLFLFEHGIGLFKNFAIRNLAATPHSSGVACAGNSSLENILVTNSWYGIIAAQDSVSLTSMISCCGNQHGLFIAPAATVGVGAPSLTHTTWNRVIFSGHVNVAVGGRGIWCVQGSYLSGGNTYTYLTGNVFGVLCPGGFLGCGTPGLTTGGVICIYNTTGIQATLNAVIFFTYESLNAVVLNDSMDLQAAAGAQISIVHNTNNTGNYNPANAILGTDGAFIRVTTP